MYRFSTHTDIYTNSTQNIRIHLLTSSQIHVVLFFRLIENHINTLHAESQKYRKEKLVTVIPDLRRQMKCWNQHPLSVFSFCSAAHWLPGGQKGKKITEMSPFAQSFIHNTLKTFLPWKEADCASLYQDIWYMIPTAYKFGGGGFFLAWEDSERMFDNSFPACTFFFFLSGD